MKYTQINEFPIFENLKHLSLREIARQTGIDASTILRLKQGKSIAKPETFETLLKLVEKRPLEVLATPKKQ